MILKVKKILSSNLFKKISGYFFLTIVFLCSDDSFFFGVNSNRYVKLIGYFILLFDGIFMLLFGFYIKARINLSAFWCSAALIVFNILSMLVNLDFINQYSFFFFIQIACILLCLIFSTIYDVEEFKMMFINVIACFSILSLAGFGIEKIFPTLFSLLPTVVNKANLSYKVFLFNAYIYSQSAESMNRLYCVFREPGVYCIYLIFSLLLLIFQDKMKRKYKFLYFILFMICIYLTKSISGYAMLIPLFVAFICKKSDSKIDVYLKISNIALVFILFFYIILSGKITNQYFTYKLFSNNSSFNSRFYSPFVDLHIWFKSPVFGVGYTKQLNMFGQTASFWESDGFADTCSLFSLLSGSGILFFTLLCFGFYRFTTNISKNNAERILIGLVIVLALFTERIILSPLFFFGPVYAFKDIRYKDVCLKGILRNENKQG